MHTTMQAATTRTIRAPWLWDGATLHTDACLRIEAGRVVELQAGDAGRVLWGRTRPRDRVALDRHVVAPGLCDAHSHAFQRVFRGHVQHRAAGDSFWAWRQAMYGAAGSLSPEAIEAVSALAFLELLAAGITAVGEFHYIHHAPDGAPYDDPHLLAERVIAAARRVGLRITLLRVVYAASGIAADGSATPPLPEQRRFLSKSPDAALRACAELEARFAADPLVVVGLAPHSVRAVPRSWLAEFTAFAGPIHAHVAEQPAEVAACRAAFGCEPLALLQQAGLLSPRFSAVHLTHPEAGDATRLRDTGARVVACPSTELDLGDGFLPPAIHAATRVAVGSDSYAQIEPLGEARALEGHARAATGQRVFLGDGTPGSLAATLLTMAGRHGHEAVGQPGGTLRPGDVADFFAVDLDRPAADGVPPLEALALSSRPEWVTDVWIAGVRRLRNGRHADEDHIRADFARLCRPFRPAG
ncbi:MAG: formimidoylglutamate deiminase [Deltaproteobacteria bacterium]|nr:formimidoylglutamate deiminase [Deltaproteobacteria bacterium]